MSLLSNMMRLFLNCLGSRHHTEEKLRPFLTFVSRALCQNAKSLSNSRRGNVDNFSILDIRHFDSKPCYKFEVA